ncbi:UvrB/UvrC motif-containing protein [Candidatus Pacebacteria bacterium]|nr:UvrB/UvrC motif-containing protein [Candidatus Paceibacterota bacterium]
MKLQDFTSRQARGKKNKIPDKPGVYLFKKKRDPGSSPGSRRGGSDILYIGKATSLKDRVRSYFSNDLLKTRGLLIVDMVTTSDDIEFIETDSVLEALILEANLIKKHQPIANTKEKDNKSYNFVVITKDEVPKVVIERGRSLEFQKRRSNEIPAKAGTTSLLAGTKYTDVFGPFPSQQQLKEALKIIRKIFPFVTNKTSSELYKQIGLEPTVSNTEAMKKYKNNLRHIKLFFNGKKKELIKDLEKQMKSLAKENKFEEAGKIRNQIFALEHIRDVSLIKNDSTRLPELVSGSRLGDSFRIEAYDAAHMSGRNSVGVMTVIEDGEVKKSDYRKFILRTAKRGDDIGSLEEILKRRLKHVEWKYPDLIVIDGGVAQVNRAKEVLKNFGSSIDIVSVVKNEKHQPEGFLGSKKIIDKFKKEILLINNESHRFAIGFYRSKQRKSSLNRK